MSQKIQKYYLTKNTQERMPFFGKSKSKEANEAGKESNRKRFSLPAYPDPRFYDGTGH